MNRIDKKFRDLRVRNRKAFIAYICAGDPSLSITKRLVTELDRAGVDIVELGVPFSDPLADGPTIQRASQRALKGKVNLPAIFSMIKTMRRRVEVPIVLMTYYNPVYSYGVRRFVKDAKASGADGVIVPDLAPEGANELIRSSTRHKFDTIFLAAPTSTTKRLRLITNRSRGFIYYVSLTGVTGARANLPSHIKGHIRQIKRITNKPVCIGFGVSNAAQVRRLCKVADGVIVGSAIINKIEKNLTNRKNIPKIVATFVKGLRKGMR